MQNDDSVLDVLHQRMRRADAAPAILWRQGQVSYSALLSLVLSTHVELDTAGIEAGQVVLLDADFSPAAVACLLALLERGAIVALATTPPAERREEYLRLCEAVACVRVDASERLEIRRTGRQLEHPLLQSLSARRVPGVIIFSSGSTGTSKAAVHEVEPLLERFRDPGRVARVVAFLLLDHIGGLNLLFYTLFAGGAVVVPEARSPDAVCAAIELHRATALTTTPTFLRLALLCQAFQRHDVSSLRVINYSSEVMAESTLRALAYTLPGVRLSQAYGLTEVGVLPVQSIASSSVLLRITGDGGALRIRDGMLEVKTKSTMLGYLNAPSPLTEDGWLRTGDAVEIEGDCLRILGRASELINVGGHKVYPAEVEDVLQDLPGVVDAVVSGQPHPVTGSLVQVAVRLSSSESLLEFGARMRAFCRDRLPPYMVPQKVVRLDQPLHSRRFKKIRAKGSVHDGTG